MAKQPAPEPIEASGETMRPPHAVVGSHRVEEEMFGKVFDGRVIGRIWPFMRPYKMRLLLAVAAGSYLCRLAARHAADHPLRY